MLKIQKIDPDWTVYAKCHRCRAVSFACCEDHLIAELADHADTHVIPSGPNNEIRLTRATDSD